MTRMPMIAVAALLLLLTTTPAAGRATKPSEASETSTEAQQEESTSLGSFDINTVTIEVDSDLILTTEDGIQAFTQLPEVGQTEEPLPESVLLQLERERLEREQHNEINSTLAITDAPESSATTKVAALVASTTVQAPIPTTESAATTESSGSRNIQSYFGQNLNLNDKLEDLVMQEEKLEAYIETTTFLPQLLTEESVSLVNNLGNFFSTERNVMLAEEAVASRESFVTSVPLVEEDHNTSGGHEFSMESNTDLIQADHSTTWLPNLAESAESTTEVPAVKLDSTLLPEVASESLTVTPLESSDNLHSMNTRNVYEIITMKPETTTTITTENLKPELTTFNTVESGSTIARIEELTETTFAAPKLQELQLVEVTSSSPDLTSTSSTTVSSTTTSTTTPIPTTDIPTTTSTSTTTTTETPTTTSTTTTTPATTTTTTTTTASTTLATTTPIPTTTSTTPVPIPTQPTRMARVERIFNSDGVEVLYGYSSVVRTHQS